MNKFLSLLPLALLAACANQPLPPAWLANAHGSLDAFTSAYLRGDTRAAEAEFARARGEMASTGRPDMVARGELVRCAVRVASMEFDGCPGYHALAQDAKTPERAYASYLLGRLDGLDPALLPAQHRPVVAGAAPAGASVLAALDDPLARLVAAGVLLQAGRITPADIGSAIETASDQGWRRPLLAWLGVAARRARAAGDAEAAARIERRIDLASQRLP